MIDAFIEPGILLAAGMSILHSFWQATLLATVLWSISRYGGLDAPGRYALGYGLLLTQLLLSALTYLYYYEPVTVPLAALPVDYVVVAMENLPAGPAAQWTRLSFWLPGLVGVWAAGLLIGSLRLAWSYGRVRSLVATSLPVAAGGDYDQLYRWVEDLADRIGYTGRLRVGITGRISGPILVGHLKPVLLFPVALVNQLSSEEAETVILHELGHLKRYDHLLNLLQCLLEVLFYYHPAIHWISARIREEREHCCDDLVVRHGPGRLAYARALLYFSEHSATSLPGSLALADGGGLVARIRRLINNQEINYTMNTRLLLLPLLALLTLAASAAYAPTKVATELTGTFPTDPAPAAAPLTLDTLPPDYEATTKTFKGKSVRLHIADGKIEKFELDGQAVPESEYSEYEAKVEELLDGRIPTRRPGADTVISVNPRTYEQDTTIVHGYGMISEDAHRVLRRLENGGHQEIIERALQQIENIDLAKFEQLGIRLDSMTDRLAGVRVVSSADGDLLLRLGELDSLTEISLPDVRQFEELQESSLESLKAQERALQEVRRNLEARKRELESEQRGTGRVGHLDPPLELNADRTIAARKAVARNLREHYLAEGRRVRQSGERINPFAPILTVRTQLPDEGATLIFLTPG